jgi:hypothetical protein
MTQIDNINTEMNPNNLDPNMDNLQKPPMSLQNVDSIGLPARIESSSIARQEDTKEALYKKMVVFYKYMSESSLFILHRDTAIRRFLIKLTMKNYKQQP